MFTTSVDSSRSDSCVCFVMASCLARSAAVSVLAVPVRSWKNLRAS
jgi:hypothetical protein